MNPQTETGQSTGPDALFDEYLSVVNRAIAANKEGVYGKAVKLWERAAGDKQIAVGVYQSDASSPHHWYTLELHDGNFDLVERGKADKATFHWKISEEHLNHVVGDPQIYVEHPVKLDLDWLKTRVGLA